MLSGLRSLLIVIILSINSFGQIFTEEFDYPIGKTFPNGSWSVTGYSPWIEQGDLIYPNYPSNSGGHKLRLSENRNYSISTSFSEVKQNSVYCSFLLNVFDLSTINSSGESFFSLGLRGYLLIKNGEANETYRLGIKKKDTSTPKFYNVDLVKNVTYVIVVAYTFQTGNDICELWINPILDGTVPQPDAYDNTLQDLASISQLKITDGLNTGFLFIDAIRVATTWNESALPVELCAFNVEAVNNNIVLNWSTATEVNNYGFEVERSYDKIQWDSVSFVPGNGNSNRVIHYSYTDNQVTRGSIVYYRLKQVDTDGIYTYSDVAEVKLTDLKYALYQNYPNPFNPETNIKYSTTQKGFVNIKVYDMTGREVLELVNESRDPGEYSVNFNGSALPSGVYMYRISVNGFVQSRKMLLLK